MTRAVALAAALALLVGCGGKTDDEQVRDTITGFVKATADKDYQRLCDDLLAPSLLESLQQIGLPCEIALRRGFGDVEEPRLTIGAVTIDGDKASAEVRTSAAGQAPSRDLLKLVRTDGRWKISELGTSGSPGATPTP